VKVLEHDAVPVTPATRVQLGSVAVTPVTPKVTLPPGVLTGAVESTTVAVQVEGWLMTTGLGAQLTVVVVG
jgi:hypothetical protein